MALYKDWKVHVSFIVSFIVSNMRILDGYRFQIEGGNESFEFTQVHLFTGLYSGKQFSCFDIKRILPFIKKTFKKREIMSA